MKFDEVVAALTKRAVEGLRLASHERIVLEGYSPEEASSIAAVLLKAGETTNVTIRKDEGGTVDVTLPCAAFERAGQRIEVIPYVVVPEEPRQRWEGSQGFASRLRDNFQYGASGNTVRVFLVFDERPLETERSASSSELATSVDSVEILVGWLTSDEWKVGFEPTAHGIACNVLGWWKEHVGREPAWAQTRVETLESGTSFMEACRRERQPGGVGGQLSKLGLLFRDPEMMTFSEKRLSKNAEVAALVESFRQLRAQDPIVAASRHIALGEPGEPFYDALTPSLRGATRRVTDAEVTLGEVERSLRKYKPAPAKIGTASIEFFALAASGEATGEGLPWQALSVPSEQDAEVELVVASPTGRALMFAVVEGDEPGWVYAERNLLSAIAAGEGTPGLTVGVGGERFTVQELQVRPQQLRGGRAPTPTQRIRIAVVEGQKIVAPDGATIDTAKRCFVVDGTLDAITVRVGGKQHVIEDERLPPEDGETIEVEVDDVLFRWRGQDRPPPELKRTRWTVRLLEQLPLRLT